MTTYTFGGVADGTLLEVAEPTLAKVAGSNPSTITVLNEVLQINQESGGTGWASWAANTSDADHFCEIVLASNFTSFTFPCAVRMTAYTTFIGARIKSGNVLELFSVVTRVETLLYSRTVSRTASDTIRLEAVGNNFYLYFNGVLEDAGSGFTATKIVTTHDAGTYAGIVVNADVSNAISEITIADLTSPAINPTGTDTDLVNGTSSNIVFSGLTSNPASVAVIYDDGVADAISSTQADFVLGTVTDGAATATFTDTIANLPYSDGTTYLAANYSYLVTCEDDSELTLDTLTFAPAAGRDFVVAVDPVSDATGIMYQWEEGGPVTGDQVDYQTDQVTVREDFTFFGPAGESDVTLNINYWDSVSQIRYPVSVIVSFDESGEGTVTGLTTRGFTAEGFTVRGFTVRGF